MKRPDYSEYIRGPAWAEKRAAFWRVHERCCVRCRATDHLHVHHHTYARLGSESMADLVGVCASCHEDAHAAYKDARALRTGEDLTAVTERVLGVALVRHAKPSGATRDAPKRPRRVRSRAARKARRAAERALREQRSLALIQQGRLPDTKAFRGSVLGDALTPTATGFVPRHLRNVVVEDGRVRAPALRPTWDKRM